MQRLQIGTAIGMLNPKYFADVAVAADELGYESLWMPEHLILPMTLSGSPFAGDEHPPLAPTTPLFDSMSYLSFIAAKTKRIRLGTNIYLLALRHPFVAARALQTLDIVSGGRAEFGVGAGWLKEEFSATGISPNDRGKRLDEALNVCKLLWTKDSISFDGEYFKFDAVKFEPKPIQKPHPPIHIGGESNAAFKRVARIGDGWYSLAHRMEDVTPLIDKLKYHLDSIGRDINTCSISIMVEDFRLDDIPGWEKIGVTRLIVTPWSRGRDAVSSLKHLANQLF